MTFGLLLTALALGFRHGVDWDHIAAIADLSSSAPNRRRGFGLSFVYALGHALVVLALGSAAIAFGSHLPSGVDVWMGRFVGLTLVAMGLWVLLELRRSGRQFRLRSRWMLVLGGTFGGLRRVREATTRRRVVIEHEHPHVHERHGDMTEIHQLRQAHDHAHGTTPVGERITVGAPAMGATGGVRRWWSAEREPTHDHRHRHDLTLAGDASRITGNGTAAGIGLLHGVGFESPTQIAIFVASSSVVGARAGLWLLVAWVAGLLMANTVLAVIAAFGVLQAERNFAVYASIAVVVGVSSLVIGTTALVGVGPLA